MLDRLLVSLQAEEEGREVDRVRRGLGLEGRIGPLADVDGFKEEHDDYLSSSCQKAPIICFVMSRLDKLVDQTWYLLE